MPNLTDTAQTIHTYVHTHWRGDTLSDCVDVLQYTVPGSCLRDNTPSEYYYLLVYSIVIYGIITVGLLLLHGNRHTYSTKYSPRKTYYGVHPARSTVSTCSSSCGDRKELGREERGELLCTTFSLDLLKAYRSVGRELLWKVLTSFGLPTTMPAAIRQFSDGMQGRVCTDDECTQSGLMSRTGVATRLGVVAVSVNLVLRCYASARAKTW